MTGVQTCALPIFVIQSIFRISINDKIQSYGQLRTIGTTPKQIRRIVKKEGRFLGWAGIGIGIFWDVQPGLRCFPVGFICHFMLLRLF